MTLRYAGQRILATVPVLFGLLVLVFGMSRLMPGDPVRLALGPTASAEQIEALREQMGLDDPLLVQFWNYLSGLFQGDMGISLRTGNAVTADILRTLPATLELGIPAMALATLIGIPLGVQAAVKRNTATDHTIRLVALTGTAVPKFWLAIVLQLLFAYWLGILPVIGRGDVVVESITGFRTIDSLITGNVAGFFDSLVHLILPTIALAVATAAHIMRMTRASMLDQVAQEYVVAARSYGLSETLIAYRYMLKNAFITVLTTLGMYLASLIGNAFLIETVFSWPGIAQYAVQSLMFKDLNAMVGVTLVVGVMAISINIVVDIMYGLIDPRVQKGFQAI